MSKAKALVDFISQSPTPYHAVHNTAFRLKSKNFNEINLSENWEINAGGKYFIKLNNSALIAFAIGKKINKNQTGFTLIASHTDSPCLKLKPNPDHEKSSFNMLGVQMYGGGVWHTWLDRDLTLAGIVYYENSGEINHKLIHINKPILRIPELAIHLNRKVNESPEYQPEITYVPVVSLNKKDQILSKKIAASEIGVQEEKILDMDLCVVDYQKSCIGGMDDEFIFAPRLDNLFNVFCSTEALLESIETDSLESEEYIRMIICYDNEEVGSGSYQGAGSFAIPNILQRICAKLGCEYSSTLSNSFVISADQAHATHPNFPAKHEANHQIDLNKGVVLKINSNQKYASSAFTLSVLKLIAKKHSLPFQNFAVRNDMGCGSTVGPIIAALIGVQVVDVGFPMLSMHSIREMCSCQSVDQAVNFFTACFKEIPSILKQKTS